jgi:hypothetical protein
MLVDDTSTDVDAVRDDLRFELIVLHGEVKKLDVSWDFTAIVNPLLADQGPALHVIPRINKQIERLKKVKDDFEQKARDLQRPAAALAQAAQSFYAAGFPNTKESQAVDKCRPQRRRQPLPDIDIGEVLPSWGECKRYSHSIDQGHYNSLVAMARQIYDKIMQSPNPRKCTLRDLCLPVDFVGAITNRWLLFQNINKRRFLLGSDRV